MKNCHFSTKTFLRFQVPVAQMYMEYHTGKPALVTPCYQTAAMLLKIGDGRYTMVDVYKHESSD